MGNSRPTTFYGTGSPRNGQTPCIFYSIPCTHTIRTGNRSKPLIVSDSRMCASLYISRKMPLTIQRRAEWNMVFFLRSAYNDNDYDYNNNVIIYHSYYAPCMLLFGVHIVLCVHLRTTVATTFCRPLHRTFAITLRVKQKLPKKKRQNDKTSLRPTCYCVLPWT